MMVQKTIAFIQGISTDEFYISMNRGVQEAAAKYGYKVLVDGPTKWDYTMQTPIVETMIARRPDIILIAPNHSVSMIASFTESCKCRNSCNHR